MPVYDSDEKPCEPKKSRCIVEESAEGNLRFFCYSEPVPVCADCPGPGDYLCDYPVGEDKTCDRQMCEVHAHQIAEEVHYCDAHFEMWQKFVTEGKVEAVLTKTLLDKEIAEALSDNVVKLKPKGR